MQDWTPKPIGNESGESSPREDPPSAHPYSLMEIVLAALFASIMPGFCLGAGGGSILGACLGVSVWVVSVWPDRVLGITELPRKDREVRNYGRWAAELDRWYARIWLVGTLFMIPGVLLVIILVNDSPVVWIWLGCTLLGTLPAGIAAAILAFPLSVMQHRSLQRRFEDRYHRHKRDRNEPPPP